MTYRRLAALCTVVPFTAPCLAHRLDEYLQATLVSVEKTRVDVAVRLVPGVTVASAVLATIDANGDGIIAEAEQSAYAHLVLRDLLLRVDGKRLTPRLKSVAFPSVEQIKEGLGQIQVELGADLPRGSARREILVENHHLPSISVFLMNCTTPLDRDIQIVRQNRTRNQSEYRITYEISGGP